MSDLIVKEDRKTRKPWITREIINKMDERRKWRNVINEEGRKNYKQVRNESKEPYARPKWSILRAYVTRTWNFKEQDVMM
jgi:hypothetical protein